MPRFFFDFRQAGGRVADTQGVVLRDVEHAYLEVFTAAQEMWSELLKQRRDPRRCFFEVRSERDEILFVFPLQEVVDSCIDRKEVALTRTFEQLTGTHNFARRVRDEFAREVQVTQKALQVSQELLRKAVG